ncbi:methyltransferase domain-containing protein [Patescibacteria group bacterium]
MKIFFTTPFEGKNKYQQYIDEIINILESLNIVVISPEKENIYKDAIKKEKVDRFGGKGKAHYEFIRQGIASSDAVIFEASYEDFRVGHEATLALMYDKPVLVLSQFQDYSKYIIHQRLIGKKYKNIEDLQKAVEKFVKTIDKQKISENYQVVRDVVDLEHSATLSELRYKATQGTSYFSDWARRAGTDTEKVYKEVIKKLGHLTVQKPWDVFAKIYNEDTPDSVFIGAAKFAGKVFKTNTISNFDLIVDVACGTGSISRLLTSFGYKNIVSFDKSRAMLAESYRLCNHMPSIKIVESDISSFKYNKPAKAMVWFDFSSNFALNKQELSSWLTNLLDNLESGGLLIFDTRTITGWNVDFFKQKITAYETENFQRLWINKPDYKKNQITFDIFIRIRDKDKKWMPWEREQMTEKMWRLDEIKNVVNNINEIEIKGIYGDDFKLLKNDSDEPGLAYFVIKKE